MTDTTDRMSKTQSPATDATARMNKVQSPVIPIVGEWIAGHPGTISLGQGVVHYAAPSTVGKAVAKAVQNDPSIDRYKSVRGIDPLLERIEKKVASENRLQLCLLYTSPSPRDATLSRMPSSA